MLADASALEQWAFFLLRADRYEAAIAEGLVPARRWGRPEDIAQTILPLARGDFAFATGAVIPVDGGLSIHRL